MPKIATHEQLNPTAEKSRSIALLTLSYLLSKLEQAGSPKPKILRASSFNGMPGPVDEHLLVEGEPGRLVWMHTSLLIAFRTLLATSAATKKDLTHMRGDWAYRMAIINGKDPTSEKKQARELASDLGDKILSYLTEELNEIGPDLDQSESLFQQLQGAPKFPSASAALTYIDGFTGSLSAHSRWKLAAIARATVVTETETFLQEPVPEFLGYVHAASTMITADALHQPSPQEIEFAMQEIAACLSAIEIDDGDRRSLPDDALDTCALALALGYDRSEFCSKIMNWPESELIIHRLRHRRFSRKFDQSYSVALEINGAALFRDAMTKHQEIEAYSLARQRLRELGIEDEPTPSWARSRLPELASDR